MNFTLVFVSQRGELELKSWLLAASLRRHLPPDTRLVAALPASDPPTQATLSGLAALKVETVVIENPLAADYPIGHKIACLGITEGPVVFLDSDMLCTRAWSPTAWFREGECWAKPVDLANFGADPGFWAPIYQHFGLALPDRRLLATVSGKTVFLYFNAGLVATTQGARLAEAWRDCCCVIDANPAIDNKRPWLDQLGLPVAITQLGLDARGLDERFNFPAHLRPLPEDLPFVVHYHAPEVIGREPALKSLVAALRTPELDDALQRQGGAWAELTRPPSLRQVQPPRDVLITGIPRSGTSYLCRLLHEVDNCVVINEPASIFAPLQSAEGFAGFPLVYRDLRRDIEAGKPVENKVRDGKVVEDTRLLDQRETYLPRVENADFLLATKNTLAYLARLAVLRETLSHALIVACIRHPLDTIASWKTSFDHLASAQVEGFPIGHPQDPWLSPAHRQRIQEIAAMPQLSMRRALLWRALAELMREERDRLLVIRYEDLVADPAAELGRILNRVGLSAHPAPTPSIPRSKREALDEADEEAIRDLCAQAAGWFGYTL